MRCHYIHDKEVGRILIPGCMSVAHTDNIEDCTCEDFSQPYSRFEKRDYNNEVSRLRKIIKDLEDHIEKIEGGNND